MCSKTLPSSLGTTIHFVALKGAEAEPLAVVVAVKDAHVVGSLEEAESLDVVVALKEAGQGVGVVALGQAEQVVAVVVIEAAEEQHAVSFMAEEKAG